jgi:hypothetical protein
VYPATNHVSPPNRAAAIHLITVSMLYSIMR